MELKHIAQRAGRLSAVLKGELHLSAGLINRLKWQEKLFVNGQPRHTDYPVQPGDVITVPMEDPAPEYPAEEGPLTILYEDDHLLALDKPAGLLIHPSRHRNSGTLANLVAGYYQKTGENCAFHPITRLDRDTFGIVLIAKHSHAHARMQALPLKKTYHALTFGGPAAEAGVIDAPIARKELPSLLREVRPDGKPSVTEFQVLERRGTLCKLELRPVTGRTHQLRVHCAHMGYPILGDPQYASDASREKSAEMGLGTQLLCAYSVEFSHPITGDAMMLTSKMDV